MSKKKQPQKKQALGRGLGSLLGDSLAEEIELTEASDDVPVEKAFAVSKEASIGESAKQTIGSGSEGRRKSPFPEKAGSPNPRVPDESRIWSIPIDKLFPNANQPRKIFAEDGLKELSVSLRQKGVIQPILARRLAPDRFEIIAGERRWRAAQLAGLHNLPVILKKTDDQQSLELALIENIQRRDLNPIEEAEAYAYLLDKYNLTQQQLADQIGKDRGTIANTTRLLNLALEIRDYVSAGKLTMGHAKVLLAVSDLDLQIKLGHTVLRQKLNVRGTEKLVQTALRGSQNQELAGSIASAMSGSSTLQKLIKGLSEELQKTIGTKVSIDYSKGKGKIQVHFYSDEELNQLVEALKKSWKN